MSGQSEPSTLLQFDDNTLLPLLFGQHDQHLARIEQQLGVSLVSRGNRLAISGPQDAVETADQALKALYQRLKKELPVSDAEVDAAVCLSRAGAGGPDGTNAAQALYSDELTIRTRKRQITPRPAPIR